MPSDLVWIAIISSGVGAGGALLGAGISGWVTHATTKRQSNAQLEGLKEQLKHNVDESRRDRMVTTRRSYLDPLRQSIIIWVGSQIEVQGLVANLQSLIVRGDAGPAFSTVTTRLNAAETSSNSAARDLNTHLGQISDFTLMEMINQIWRDTNESSAEIQRLSRQSYDMGVQLRSGTVTEALKAEFGGWHDAMEALIERRQKQYLLINKRVESLLNGDDAV